MQGDFLTKIRAEYNQFTKAEKKVADYILQNPREVLFMSITDLAEVCEVGDTSVFRFCKTMNLKGYQEFKMMLSLSLHDGKSGLGQLDGDISQEDSFSEMAQKVLNTNVNALKETFSLLNEENFDKVIRHLHDADRICFYGVGASTVSYTHLEVQMNNYTTLKPFDKYYGGTANFTIHLNPSAGDSDANFVTNAKAGKLDYAYTKNIADVKALEGTPGLTIDTVNVRYTRLLYLNKFDKKDGKKAPLADEKVRQAIAYALDMKSILDGVFEGAALPANSLTPDGADKVDGLNNYDYNPEKAKELLKEANWDPNTELDVVYYYTDQMTQDLMAIIQQYLAEVGIKMNARLVEGDLATILWKAPEDPVNGPSAVDWDMCYAANAALSLHEYYDRYQTGYSINSHTPSDPKLDELIAATNASVDAEVQRKAFFELQKYENETLFELPLYYQPIFLLQSDKIVKGAKLGNPQFNYNWDIQNWEIK